MHRHRRSRGSAPSVSASQSGLCDVRLFVVFFVAFFLSLCPAARGEPAYVDDATCGSCHDEIWRSYQDVGMARSFTSGEAAERIEIWTGEGSRFFHQPSGRWYEMKLSRDGRPVFARWQVDEDGEEIHRWEREVDWILGSGHTSRSYLVHLPGGELFVLPVAWYTQENRWDMAPGFELGDHIGLGRRVRRECMFCHNAYPDLAAMPDDVGEPHAFPFELPHGTGCQRCHGPGSEHVDAAIFGGLPGAVREEIVNPGRLPPTLRDDVCRQCHMQPAVSILPARRFGRATYSYRPGEPIDEYLVFFDPQVDPASLEAPDGVRFEINHHPYRLEQSRCWTESRGRPDALSCLTCHDPHRKVPPAERAAHYREACLSCHQLEACDLQRMGDAVRAGLPQARREVAAGNCVGCHMPRRRTRDVIHVVMTDHQIQARPGGAELTAPIDKSQPVVLDLELLYPERDPQGPLAEVYRALAAVRAGSGADSGVAEHFERNLRRAGREMPREMMEPWLELGQVQLRFGRTDEALRSFRRSRDLMEDGHPLLPELLASTGLAAVPQRRTEEAISALRASLAADPAWPDLHFNLGRLLLAVGDTEEALGPLHRAVGLRPLFPDGWFHLGVALERVERPAEAAEAWRMALSVDPSSGTAAMALGRLLVDGGEREEGLRILRHAARWADDPAPVRAVLKEMEEREKTGPEAQATDAAD